MSIGFKAVAVVVLVAVSGCGEKEYAEYLNVHKVLEKTQAELTRSFGPPDSVLEKTDTVDILRWQDIDGDSTHVYVIVRDDISRYVTYTFRGMKPFDAKEALKRVGIPWPEAEPEHVWEDGSKRWKPFDEYEKLVISHSNNAVSVGELLPLHRPE